MFYTNICITAKKENDTLVGLCFFYIVFIMSETLAVLIKLSCCQPLPQREELALVHCNFFYFKIHMLSLVCACVHA